MYSGTVPNLKTLLLVDDDSSIHELVRAILADESWEVEAVSSGEEALAKLANRSYDLVLTDIRMPGMDGITLLTHIRKQHPQIRVVVMTVHNTPDHIVSSLRNEAAGYVSKPLSRDSFVESLQNALYTTLEHDDIKILSDRPQWISLEVCCKAFHRRPADDVCKRAAGRCGTAGARSDCHGLPGTADERH